MPRPLPPDFAEQRDRAITVDSESLASNPANFRVRWLHFFRAFPQPARFLTFVLLVLGSLALRGHWLWLLAFAPLATLAIVALVKVREHFCFGNLLPGLIVSQDPPLVAVLTDLSKGYGQFNAVKIVEQPLKACGLKGAPLETRIVAVALYTGATGEEKPHWSDFDPVLLNAATPDEAERHAALESFEADDWAELEAALEKVPQPFEPGLFPIGWDLPRDHDEPAPLYKNVQWFSDLFALDVDIDLYEASDKTDANAPRLLLLRFKGDFAATNAPFIALIHKMAIQKWQPDGLILDLAKLKIPADLDEALREFLPRNGVAQDEIPAVVICGEPSQNALKTLLLGADSGQELESLAWVKPSLDEAKDWVELRARMRRERDRKS